MKIREFEQYKAVYCSLCRNLGKSNLKLSRLFLSYDATFLALLSLSLEEKCTGFEKGKCVLNPLKRCNFCIMGEKNFSFVSSVLIIMTYYKVLDDIEDSKYLKKIRAILLYPIVKISYKKAAKMYPEVKNIIKTEIENQRQIEKDIDVSIDKSADQTAKMMSKILCLLSTDKDQEKALQSLGYFLGRWIYLIDAFDDMEKDLKNNNFNPFVEILINKMSMTKKEANKYARNVLNQTLANIMISFNLLNLNQFKNILENIVMLGLENSQNEIIKRKRGKRNESI